MVTANANPSVRQRGASDDHRLTSLLNRCFEAEKLVFTRVGLLGASLLVCVAFASIEFPLFAFGLIHYNPFTTVSDFAANFFGASILVGLTGSMAASVLWLSLLYFAGGLKHVFLRRNLTVGDLSDIPELWNVLTFEQIALGALVLFACAGITFWLVTKRRQDSSQLRNRAAWLLLPTAIIGTAWAFPEKVLPIVEGGHINQFNRGADFLEGGQLYAVAYDFVEKASLRNQLANYRGSPDFKLNYSFSNNITKKNIHLILMESYTSLERLGIDGGNMVTPPPYKKLDHLTYAISPVFGGNSAAAEYEILCGTVENFLFGGLTFNSFSGNPTSWCLPGQLHNQGYHAMASSGTKGYFFNAEKAYQSMKFDWTYFYDSYPKQDLDEIRISDKELFAENRKNLVARLREAGGPIFNYVSTIAGHGPYSLNKNSRPFKLDHSNDGSRQYVNRVLYSEIELNQHLEELRKIDPNSIVLVVGDHLVSPALEVMDNPGAITASPIGHRKVDYLLLDNFKQIDGGNLAYHEFGKAISLLLSGECAIDKSMPGYLGSNAGHYQRADLTPILVGENCKSDICKAVLDDRKYQNELSFEILKGSQLAQSRIDRGRRSLADNDNGKASHANDSE